MPPRPDRWAQAASSARAPSPTTTAVPARPVWRRNACWRSSSRARRGHRFSNSATGCASRCSMPPATASSAPSTRWWKSTTRRVDGAFPIHQRGYKSGGWPPRGKRFAVFHPTALREESDMLKLYGYWRSTAAYRVRIDLNLKGLTYQQVPVHLLKDGGQQHAAEYRALNPQQLVPLLVDGELRIAQSLAILEYLDEVYPLPALLPEEPAQRAQVRALALHIACDVHPLNNLRVLQYLANQLGVDEEAKDAWLRHWLALGLTAVEQGLAAFEGRLSLGQQPGYLEACLIPQLYNARRFNCALDAYPRILAMAARCESLEAFKQAAPEVQPDAQ